MKMLSAEEFRKKLVGIVDKSKTIPLEEDNKIKQAAIQFCSLLPELFSEDFDRKTLWTRIGNGIISGIKKCGGDYEIFINLVLEFIKADPGKTAENKKLEIFLHTIIDKSTEWKTQFLRIVEKKYNIILVYAKNKWDSEKYKSKKNKNKDETLFKEEISEDGFIDEIPINKKRTKK